MIIYFDENMPKHLAEGFQIIQFPESIKTGIKIEIKYLPEEFDYGMSDKDWLSLVGKQGNCVITQDINISRRKDELSLYKKYGVGIFFLKGTSKKHGMTIWSMTQALSKNWSNICEIAVQENGPFGYEFSLNRSIKKLHI